MSDVLKFPTRTISTGVREAVLAGLKQLAIVYTRSSAATGDAEEVFKVYASALADLEPRAIVMAVDELVQEHTFFPKPADWRRATKTKQRELYEASEFKLVAQVPQYGGKPIETYPTVSNGRLPAHMAMVALSMQFGPNLERVVEVDPDHAAVWRGLCDTYHSCSEAAGNYPTIDDLRAYLTAGGANLRLLDAAISRGPGVAHAHGYAVGA